MLILSLICVPVACVVGAVPCLLLYAVWCEWQVRMTGDDFEGGWR